MSELIDIKVGTWDNYWRGLSEKEKHELVDLYSPWKPNPRIIERDNSFTKIRTLQIAMSAAFRTKKYEQIDEALSFLKTKYGYSIDGGTSYECLLLTLLEIASNEGTALDRYELLGQLADYYHFNAHEVEKALLFYSHAKNTIQDCFDEYTLKRKLSEDETKAHFKGFIFIYYRALLDAHQYKESRLVEKELMEQWLPMSDKDMEIIYYYRYLRMMGIIEKWETDGEPIESYDDVESLIEPLPIYAANIYKAIAFNYYKKKEYTTAKEFYEKAHHCYPNMVGVNSKLQIINKKLSRG